MREENSDNADHHHHHHHRRPLVLPIKSTLWSKPKRSTTSIRPEDDSPLLEKVPSIRKCYVTTSLALPQKTKQQVAVLEPNTAVALSTALEVLNVALPYRQQPYRRNHSNNPTSSNRTLPNRKKARAASKAPTLTPLELRLVPCPSRKNYRTTTLVPRKTKHNIAAAAAAAAATAAAYKIPPFYDASATNANANTTAPRLPVGGRLVSAPFKSFDSLQVNLKSQARKLEENIHSLTNVKTLQVNLKSQARRLEESIHSLTNVKSLQVNLRNKAKKLEESLYSLRQSNKSRLEGATTTTATATTTSPAIADATILPPISEFEELEQDDSEELIVTSPLSAGKAGSVCTSGNSSRTVKKAMTFSKHHRAHRKPPIANDNKNEPSDHAEAESILLEDSTLTSVVVMDPTLIGIIDSTSSVHASSSQSPRRRSSSAASHHHKVEGRQRSRRSFDEESLQKSTLSRTGSSKSSRKKKTKKVIQKKQHVGDDDDNEEDDDDDDDDDDEVPEGTVSSHHSGKEVIAVILEESQAMAFPIAEIHEHDTHKINNDTSSQSSPKLFCNSQSLRTTSPSTVKTESMSTSSSDSKVSSLANSTKPGITGDINLATILEEPLATALPIAQVIEQGSSSCSKGGPMKLKDIPPPLSGKSPTLHPPVESEGLQKSHPSSECSTAKTSSSRLSVQKNNSQTDLVAVQSQGTFSTQTTASHASDSKKIFSARKSVTCCSYSTGIIHMREVALALEKFSSKERSLKDQIDSLTQRERNCVTLLRQHWESDHPALPGHMYLRFARSCQFDLRRGRRTMSNFDTKYLDLTVVHVESQLLSLTLFPIPGLKSVNGLDMFYMRPALFLPNSMKTQTIVDNLAYVMLTMVEREEASSNGIGLLAYMNDCTMENFSVDYCRQFMKMLQGGVPARVCLFLIVNPPSWFGTLWKIMKPMLHPTFRGKVKIIPEKMLPHYLAMGYPAYLPSDTTVGSVNPTKLVKEFIYYRKHVEEKRCKRVYL